jgi:hypothetical protein
LGVDAADKGGVGVGLRGRRRAKGEEQRAKGEEGELDSLRSPRK